MPRHAPELECSPEDAASLFAISKSRTEEARTVERARIILASLERKEIQQVAQELAVSVLTVGKWRTCFALWGTERSSGSTAVGQTSHLRRRVSGPRARPVGATASAGHVALGWTGGGGHTRLQRVCGMACSSSRRHLPAKAAQLVCEYG